MKVLVVRVGQEPVIESIDNDYKSIQTIIGGYFEQRSLGLDLVILCNEEGELIDLPRNRRVHSPGYFNKVILGDFLICRVGSKNYKGIGSAYETIWKKRLQLGEVQQ